MNFTKEQQDAFNAFVNATLPKKDREIAQAMENLVDSLNMAMIGMDNRLLAIINTVSDLLQRQKIESIIIEEMRGSLAILLQRSKKEVVKELKAKKFKPVGNILEKKISDVLELSVFARNRLKNDSIIFIKDLVAKSPSELLKTPNFGRKSLNEIKDELEKRGLFLGMNMGESHNAPS